MSDIRLELQRSGGFAGLIRPPKTLETAGLPPEMAREIEELVEKAETTPPRTAPQRSIPDATQYDLTIQRGGQVRRLSYNDATIPPEVRELVKRIEAEGRDR
jgi:hypothetical protein